MLNGCRPNDITMKTHFADCGDNQAGKAPTPASSWTTVEAATH